MTSRNVSQLLKAWRLSSRPLLLQDDAARLLGVSYNTYSRWEQGRAMPYPEMLRLAIERLRTQ